MSVMKRLDYHITNCSNSDEEGEGLKTEINECLHGTRHWSLMSRKAQDILAMWEMQEQVDVVNWSEYPDHEMVTRS
jgi:hypothetical protein